ncbi:MAG: hypothetical protein AVDCRST_MAG59-4064, partial [uncultured Thermomicrobiales bacterium]
GRLGGDVDRKRCPRYRLRQPGRFLGATDGGDRARHAADAAGGGPGL